MLKSKGFVKTCLIENLLDLHCPNMGSTLLCITNDNQLIKKWINFVKIKCHWCENIEWNFLQLELNWN
jgi:aspartate carbamoyltransferase regulatory subunit